jgi:hypothetical protein
VNAGRIGRGQPPDARIGAVESTEYLSLRSLAGYSGLSVRRLRDHLVDPLHPLPHYRVGGKILVRRADFDLWAEQFKVHAAPETLDSMVDDIIKAVR